ncbi:MAG: MBL fold metallo-hydrolase, partial [Thermonemataceae bacterium]
MSTLSVVCSGYGQVEPLPVYTSSSLVIQPITPQVFLHTSYLATDKYGKVPCNGILYREGNTTVVFDTPTDNATSEELISWINDELQCQVKAVIVTHFHADCLGGLDTFHKRKIASYAHQHTIALAKEKGSSVPQYGFEKSLEMILENKKDVRSYYGEGHTTDIIEGYIP